MDSSELNSAIQERWWLKVLRLLKWSTQLSSSERSCAVDTLISQVGTDFSLQDLVPHCTGEQLQRLLARCTSNEWWGTVAVILKKSVDETQHRLAIEEASKKADDETFACEILHLCHGDQLEDILTNLVTRGLWRSVGEVLQRGVSDVKRRLVVEEASKIADDLEFYKHILPYCKEDQFQTVLETLVTRGSWRSVSEVLTKGVNDNELVWTVKEASKTADDDDFKSYILPYCEGDLLENVLSQAVARGMWHTVDKVLTRGVSEAKLRWAVEEASKTADDWTFIASILPHCATDQLETALTQLVSRGLWLSVNKVLTKDISEEKLRWAVEEASKTANDWNFYTHILLYCVEDHLETVLTHLVTRGMWISVDKVLAKGVSDAKLRWVVEEASKTADDKTFKSSILPHCKEDETETVMTHLVTRGLWNSVDEMLQRGVSDITVRWTVDTASKIADDRTFQTSILLYCKADQLETILAPLVARGLWGSVNEVLTRGVSDAHRRWAVEKASQNALPANISIILRHCCADQMAAVLTSLQSRQLWTDDSDFQKLLCQYNFNKQQLDSVLEFLVTQGMWKSVIKVLQKGVSAEKRNWAIEEAGQRAEWDWSFTHDMLKNCSQEHNIILMSLVTRSLWRAVGQVLENGVTVSEAKQRWAVEEASQKADDGEFRCHILKHCIQHDFDTILTSLVTRGLWNSVDEVLQKGVSTEKHNWAVEKAIQTADDGDFICHILEHCNQHHCDTVLVSYATRDLWQYVGKVLYKGVSAEKRGWAIEEAGRRAENDDFICHILRHCSHEHLDTVLTTLVNRGLWQSVDQILQEGVSVQKHNWAIEKASQTADDQNFARYILRHCSQDHVDTVWESLVERGLWLSVGEVLDRGVSDTQLVLAAEEASRKAAMKDFEVYILPFCSEDVLVSVLSNLEKRKLFSDTGSCEEEEKMPLHTEISKHEVSRANLLSQLAEGTLPFRLSNLERRELFSDIDSCEEERSRKMPLHAEVSKYEVSRVNLLFQLAKGADPFRLTENGESVLFHAARNNYHPHKVVAECIRLGFSTHQPLLTGEVTNDKLLNTVSSYTSPYGQPGSLRMRSPFLHAAMKNKAALANMLYESGACSDTEPFLYYMHLEDTKNEHTCDTKRGEHMRETESKDAAKGKESISALLKEMATTPRSLMSTCRLVISHCLKAGWRRHQDVQLLPLSDKLKNYILFSDLTDPDSPTYLYKGLSDETDTDSDSDYSDDDYSYDDYFDRTRINLL